MVRALLICSLHNIASFRRLCSAISENIAYRWFCFLTIDDPVFDHSTITYFINRIGRDGFSEVFDGLNQELLRMGLLSPEMYADSSMVKANVNNFGLSRSDLSVEGFKEQAIEENGLFVLTSSTVDDKGVERQEVGYFQDARSQLPLSPVDTDARWRTTRSGKPSGLNYQESIIVDLGGFIVAREITHASEGEWKALPELLEKLPLKPVSLAAGTAYSVGQLRNSLREKASQPAYRSTPTKRAAWLPRGTSSPGRPFDLSSRQGAPPQRVAKTGSRLSVRGPPEGLPVLSRQSPMPATQPETKVCGPQHVSPSIAPGAGTEKDFGVPPGEKTAADNRRGDIRFIGSSGLGPVPVARVVEGGLRRIHGGSGPQRAEAGAHIEPRCRATGSGDAGSRRTPGVREH